MSEFEGVEKFGPKAERLPTLTEGEYLLESTKNASIETQTGRALLREFKIISAVGDNALKPGTEAKGKLLYFSAPYVKARIAEYVRALTSAEKVDSKLCDTIFGAKNPAAGKKIKVRVESATSDGGKPYLRENWRYVQEDDAPAAP